MGCVQFRPAFAVEFSPPFVELNAQEAMPGRQLDASEFPVGSM